jgi:hypothetical protein
MLTKTLVVGSLGSNQAEFYTVSNVVFDDNTVISGVSLLFFLHSALP